MCVYTYIYIYICIFQIIRSAIKSSPHRAEAKCLFVHLFRVAGQNFARFLSPRIGAPGTTKIIHGSGLVNMQNTMVNLHFIG